MSDTRPNLIVNVAGDVHGPLNVAGDDIILWDEAKKRGVPPQEIKPPVFVSYAGDDRDKLIKPLVRRLEEAGYTAWFD